MRLAVQHRTLILGALVLVALALFSVNKGQTGSAESSPSLESAEASVDATSLEIASPEPGVPEAPDTGGNSPAMNLVLMLLLVGLAAIAYASLALRNPSPYDPKTGEVDGEHPDHQSETENPSHAGQEGVRYRTGRG